MTGKCDEEIEDVVSCSKRAVLLPTPDGVRLLESGCAALRPELSAADLRGKHSRVWHTMIIMALSFQHIAYETAMLLLFPLFPASCESTLLLQEFP